jgi:hypothetical protein
MKKSATTPGAKTQGATIGGESPSRLIDARIDDLDDWRGTTLAHVRALIRQADPEVARRPGLVSRRHHLHRRDL